jgi:hypothetical protein
MSSVIPSQRRVKCTVNNPKLTVVKGLSHKKRYAGLYETDCGQLFKRSLKHFLTLKTERYSKLINTLKMIKG